MNFDFALVMNVDNTKVYTYFNRHNFSFDRFNNDHSDIKIKTFLLKTLKIIVSDEIFISSEKITDQKHHNTI